VGVAIVGLVIGSLLVVESLARKSRQCRSDMLMPTAVVIPATFSDRERPEAIVFDLE
jgi:hypothetical protein